MTLPPELRTLLRDVGLLGDEEPAVESLVGGVSSDVLVIHTTPEPVCAKRALPQLRVAGTWEAPVSRSGSEARWLATAAALVPGIAPQLLAHGEGWLVLSFLPPSRWTVWKSALLAGEGDAPAIAARLGTALGQLHDRAAADPTLPARFDTTAEFISLRLAPYLRRLGQVHPGHVAALRDVEASLLANRRTLVHGDVSPKNVLVAADATPVLIDAECAWWGDAAFDLAFCANHLLLKQLVVADPAPLRQAVSRYTDAYLAEVNFEPAESIATRASRLLPWLLLARVDGLSPVEYLDAPRQQRVRDGVARLLEPSRPRGLDSVLRAWGEFLDD